MIRIVRGNVNRGSLEFARHRTVKQLLAQVGMAFFLLGVIFDTAQPCRASEVVDEIHNFTREREE